MTKKQSAPGEVPADLAAMTKMTLEELRILEVQYAMDGGLFLQLTEDLQKAQSAMQKFKLVRNDINEAIIRKLEEREQQS